MGVLSLFVEFVVGADDDVVKDENREEDETEDLRAGADGV